MKKLSMHTPDLTKENIEKIAKLFPNVITEKEAEGRVIERAVDFDLLRQELQKELVEDECERYRLDWPGKKASLLKANTPIFKTLRPDRERSVHFDITENLFIEGDNFEVLKILQESYLGRVKMIYIDPPYNTGKDFVYKDSFKVRKEEYAEELNVEDENGGKLVRNTDTNGRFHSDWLSMMYERLLVARDLLKDDGVIFISIDGNEVHNLRKLCDEIFGESNFVGEFVWKNKLGGGNDSAILVVEHEFILCYGKNIELIERFVLPNIDNGKYLHEDEFVKKRGKFAIEALYRSSIQYSQSLFYPIETPDGTKIYPNESDPSSNRHIWRWSPETFERKKKEGRILFKKTSNGWRVFSKQYFLEDDDGNPRVLSARTILDFIGNRQGTELLKSIFDNTKIFDGPKPVDLIKHFLCLACHDDELFLDFFAGSASSAHAVIAQNAEDGGSRRFIMVQIPEQTPKDSEAHKAGYDTISEIGLERIRRAGKKILKENAEILKERETPLDVGFRAYRTDSTNMRDVYYHPSEIKQEDLFNAVSNIKEDRTPEDLLTQVLLDLGLTLDLPIETKNLRGNTVYFVAGNALVACFDDNIDFGIVDDIAASEPLKVVFMDASFKDDKDRINVETRIKRLSPESIITVL